MSGLTLRETHSIESVSTTPPPTNHPASRSLAKFGPDTSLPSSETFYSVRSNTTETGWIDIAPTS